MNGDQSISILVKPQQVQKALQTASECGLTQYNHSQSIPRFRRGRKTACSIFLEHKASKNHSLLFQRLYIIDSNKQMNETMSCSNVLLPSHGHCFKEFSDRVKPNLLFYPNQKPTPKSSRKGIDDSFLVKFR